MKRHALVVVLVLVAAARAFSGDDCCKPAEVKVPGFQRLRSLAGEWQVKVDGKPGPRVTYQETASGTALLETHLMPGASGTSSMVTLYHADGDALVLTHYCSLGNQPRMKATKVTEDEIVFEFRDATNLAKPTDPHMHALTIRFKDKKHFSEEWTFRGDGKDKKHVFEWERVEG